MANVPVIDNKSDGQWIHRMRRKVLDLIGPKKQEKADPHLQLQYLLGVCAAGNSDRYF